MIGNCCSNIRDLEDALQKKEVATKKPQPQSKSPSTNSARPNLFNNLTNNHRHMPSSNLDDEERNSDASFLDVEEYPTSSRERHDVVSTSTDGDLRSNNLAGNGSVDIYQSQIAGYNPASKSASSSSNDVDIHGRRAPSLAPQGSKGLQSSRGKESKTDLPGKKSQVGSRKR